MGPAPESKELTIVVRGDRRELELQEKLLAQREESLHTEKNQLEQRIDELAKSLSAADVEQRRRLNEELTRARQQQGEVAVKVNALQAQKTEVEAKRTALDPPALQVNSSALGVREATVATREAKLAEREQDFARRERELASRETRLSQQELEQGGRVRALNAREEQLASSEKESPQQRLLSLREIPKASAVEQKHRRVLDELDSRGILIADLPVEDQPLNAEIWVARRQGDFARAGDLIAELGKSVKHLKVEQRFVEQKMVRLQAMRGASSLTDAQRKEVERLLREVTGAYSDGHYELANKGLNRIATILDANPSPG